MKFRILCTAAILSAVAMCSTSQAGIIPGVLNQVQFDDREVGINPDGSPATNLVVGTRLSGVLNSNTINTVLGIQSPVSPEVTGVFDITAAFVIDSSTNTVIDPVASSFTGTAFVLFRPTNIGGGEGALGALDSGTAVGIWQGGTSLNTTLDDAGKTTADAFMAASDGTFIAQLGSGGGANGTFDAADYDAVSDWGTAGNFYWYAAVDYENGQAATTSDFYYGLELTGGLLDTYGPATPLLNVNLPVNILIPTGTSIGDNKSPGGTIKFDFVGKGSTQPNDDDAGTTPEDQDKFPIFSQDPARIQPAAVPEPTSLLLMTIAGLCGVPFLRSKKKSMESAA